MNPVHDLANVIAEITKKRDASLNIDEIEAYNDCLCLLQPYLELLAINTAERLNELAEVTEAIKKLAIREGMETK